MDFLETLDERTPKERLDDIENEFYARVDASKVSSGCMVDCLMKMGLLIEEAIAIHDYKTDKPWIFNKLLVNGRTEIPHFLESAIRKLPRCEGNKTFRHDKIEHFSLNSQMIGKTLTSGRFLSTSKNESFGDGYDMIIEINCLHQSNSIDLYDILSKCGIREVEKEILFPPQTMFRIESLIGNTLVLEEVNVKPDEILPSIFSIRHLMI